MARLDQNFNNINRFLNTPYKAVSFTNDEKTQARANLGAGPGATNPNLFINPWFTINQRGRTSFSGNGMFVDGWRVTYGTAVRTINADGTVTIGHGHEGNMTNRIDLPIDALAGKTVTVSVMLADGTIGSWTRTVPSATSSNQRVFEAGFQGHTITFYVAANTAAYSYYVNLYTGPNSTRDITLRAFKLEVGSVSTLANDAPPDYASELAKCRYYFQRVTNAGSSKASTAMGYSYSGGGVFFGLISPMRARPSITRTGTWQVQPLGGTGVNVTAQSIGYNEPYYSVSLGASGITAGQTVLLYGDAGATLDFSAEL